jgi:hypothetical protein
MDREITPDFVRHLKRVYGSWQLLADAVGVSRRTVQSWGEQRPNVRAAVPQPLARDALLRVYHEGCMSDIGKAEKDKKGFGYES